MNLFIRLLENPATLRCGERLQINTDHNLKIDLFEVLNFMDELRYQGK